MTFRVGILGSGNISGTHARAAAEIDGVEVVASWGRDRTRAEAFAERHATAAYGDLDAFLAHPGLDAVIVGTASGVHADHATAAARRGLHVLVEKPLEVTAERADGIVEACDRAGVTLGVIFQDRTAPDLVWVKRAIAVALGTPILASARVKWYRPPDYYAASAWRGTWALDGGGALMNQGIHTVDLLLWLFGDVSRVHALTRTALHAIEVEDTAVACLEFARGAVGTLEATTAAYPGFSRRLELTGSEGTIAIEADRVVSVDLKSPPPEPPPKSEGSANASASSPVVADVRGHRRVIEDFVASVRAGRAPLCSGRDGRRSVALVEAVYRSARSGRAEDVA